MKKVSTSLLKNMNWLLGGLLALLGFTTCDGGADMYGTPYANFTIKGKVVNEGSTPIPDIEIKCLTEHHGDGRSWFDTIPAASTSSAGTFTCQFEEFPTGKIRIIATEVDGALNGSYKKDSTDITVSGNDYKGGKGGWFKGSVEKEVNFILKEEIKNE